MYRTHYFDNRLNHNHGLLLANGKPPSKNLLKSLHEQSKHFIALDGGANQAHLLGITPDLILGDLDSVNTDIFPHIKKIHLKDQNTNDLMKGLEYCLNNNIEAVTVLGALGQRIDHILTNLHALSLYACKIPIQLEDEEQIAIICPTKHQLLIKGWYKRAISLFPWGQKVGPVNTKGLFYELDNLLLSTNGPISTLNFMSQNEAQILCNDGILLVMLAKNAT